ncbi:MAG: hypothetical protein K6F82_05180 [Sphaerochaetaceae bacterium]|nr:hypothetical protein [Sphaerochaetaceae bacterium]
MKKEIDANITVDRMRYTKNKTAANLAILAILFDVFYFVNIYKSDVSTYYYNILVGGSIVFNLLFLLAAFLCSEEIKQYNEKYCYLLLAMGVIQFVRIFIIPTAAHSATVVISNVEKQVMEDGQFIRCVLYLCISGACCIAGALIGIARSRKLKAYIATLGEEKRRD